MPPRYASGTPRFSLPTALSRTKEQLIAFFTVNCDDLAEAIEVAAKIPAAGYGVIEVRPVVEM